ncbi:MAG: ROK family protein [Bacilli bacterium]|jgi:glucokinase
MNSTKNIRIAVDIGGTFIKGGLLRDGAMIRFDKIPSFGSKGREAILRSLFALIDSLMDQSVEAICVSTAGEIDPKQGIILYASDNLRGWTGLCLKEVIESHYHIPAFIENDAYCHLLAEKKNYPDSSNITLLTLGTGVGGASIINGKLDRSKKTNWGYRIIVPNGRYLKGANEHGSAEAYLSLSSLCQLMTPFPSLNLENIFQLFINNNEEASCVMNEYGRYLNMLLDLIQDEVQPNYIIIGGGLSENREAIMKMINGRHANVRLTVFGNASGVIGAYFLPDIDETINIK